MYTQMVTKVRLVIVLGLRVESYWLRESLLLEG